MPLCTQWPPTGPVWLLPPPLLLVGPPAIAYWNTHQPGTGPHVRRLLGAPA